VKCNTHAEKYANPKWIARYGWPKWTEPSN
jgi:hypothetical protein